MSMKYLGESFDIHAGGIDHIPIHHTNEIAQSEAATGKSWVNYWLHGEFVVMDKGKMSKSSGSFLTLQTLVDAGYDPLDYRYFVLGGHYRSQLQFSYEALDSARAARTALTDRVRSLRSQAEPSAFGALGEKARSYLETFGEHLATDLAVPRALADLWGLLRDAEVPAADALGAAFDMDRVLGLSLSEAAQAAQAAAAQDVDSGLAEEVNRLIAERAQAKKNRDYAKADGIRDSLAARGIRLEDGPAGTTWKRAKEV